MASREPTTESLPTTLPASFAARVAAGPNEEAVRYKLDGRWQSLTWAQLDTAIGTLAGGLSEWVAPGEICCLLSENRPEWWIADQAVLALGGVVAAIYPTSPAKDIAYIVNDCGATLIFVSTAEQLAKIVGLQQTGEVPHLRQIIVFDAVDSPAALTLTAVQQRHTEAPDPRPERAGAIAPNDLATLTYTSGTTGEPKGVMLSHRNILANAWGARAIIDALDLPDKLMLSFLPLSHSFERTVGYYAAIALGFRVAFAEEIAKLPDNLREVRPTMLVSVPRIYEKVYARFLASAAGPKKALLTWALAVGKRRARLRLDGRHVPFGLRLQAELADRLVFSKLRARLGGRLRYAISGSAPLAVEVNEFLRAAGLEVFEGYGLSETSPILTGNRPGKVRLGSVGLPWPEVELRLEPDPQYDGGEILARGPNIMLGYYRKPEATAEVLDADGWFRTGDIGYLDADGFLFITDRKKELIKTAGGKFVAPQPLENALRHSPLVEQAVVLGDRRPYCIALLVPNAELCAAELGRPLPREAAALAADTEARALFEALVVKANAGLGRWEQLKRFALLAEPLTQEDGALTPTLKVKRRAVEQRYATLIEALYSPRDD